MLLLLSFYRLCALLFGTAVNSFLIGDQFSLFLSLLSLPQQATDNTTFLNREIKQPWHMTLCSSIVVSDSHEEELCLHSLRSRDDSLNISFGFYRLRNYSVTCPAGSKRGWTCYLRNMGNTVQHTRRTLPLILQQPQELPHSFTKVIFIAELFY